MPERGQDSAAVDKLHQQAGQSDSARLYLVRALRAWQLVDNHQRSNEVRDRLRTLSGV